MIGRSFHLVIVCLLVTSSHQIDFNQLIKSVSGNCGSLLQAYRSSLSDCQSFRSIQSKLTPPFCTSGDINKLEEVLCGTQSPASSSLPSGGTNTGGVTSAGVPVQHSSQASAVVKVTTDVTSPTNTTVDVGTTVPVKETELQITFRELGDELTSPLCKIVLNDQAKVLTSFQQVCCMLISYKTTLVPMMCTQLEYDKVHDVLCVNVICPTTAAPEHVTNSSQASKEHKEKVLCIIDTQLSSDSCRATARQQAEGESEQGHACETLKSFQPSLAALGCTKQDYDTLYSVICDDVDTTCTNTGGVTSAGVPVQHSSQASAVVKETTDVTSPTDTTVDVSTTVPVKETTDVMSPTDTTVDVGTTVPVNETEELQKTFRELGDELTSPMCKAVLNDRATVWTSITEACCMLISYKTTLVPTMCTQLEYDKVYDVLCVNVNCHGNGPTDDVTSRADNMTTRSTLMSTEESAETTSTYMTGTTTSTDITGMTTSVDTTSKTTSTDITGMTTSVDTTSKTTSTDITGMTTSVDTTSKTTSTDTTVATIPISTTSPDTTSSTTAPPRANIFPLKLRLLFSVITNDDVKEQLEVLVN